MSIDLLYSAFSSTGWGIEINARYNSIIVKGFSVTRQILEMSNDDVSDPTAVSVATRFDRKGLFGGI